MSLRSVALRWAAAAFRVYHRTLRVRLVTPEGTLIHPSEHTLAGKLYALCERDALALGGFLRETSFVVIIAHGRDGDWATEVVEAFGCRVYRGSSGRGGPAALRGVLDHLAQTRDAAGIVVDGPLGPAGVAKPGVVICAARTGRPLVALGVHARWRLTFPRTWSGIYLPLPFTAVFVAYLTTTVKEDADVGICTEQLTRDLALARDRAAATARGERPAPTARA